MEKIYKCECGKQFTNPQSFNGHKSNCEKHLKSVGKYAEYIERRQQGYNHTKQTNQKNSEKLKKLKLDKWVSEQHVCEKCGKVMTEKFGSGRFCSRACANSHVRSLESNLKTSLSLKNNLERKLKWKYNKYKENYYKNPKLCLICGNVLPYEHRKGKVCCKKCQNELERIHKIELCAKQGINLCGKGKRGYYKGYYCQSSWELAYVIYCLEHNIEIKRNKERFKYILDGIERSYFPDFILKDGTYVEIKGYYDNKTKEKEKQFPKDKKLIILKEKEMLPLLEYVKNKYGNNFIELYNIV